MATGISPILRESHRLRKHLTELRAEIERGPRVLKAHQTRLAKTEEEFRAAQEHLKKLQLQIREQEGTLKSVNQQIGKYEGQREKSISQKEIEAFGHQIDHLKQQGTTLEESILTAMSEVEERTARLPEEEKKLQAAKAEFAQFEKDAQTRLARLVQEVQLAEAELKKVEGTIPDAVRPQYERLLASYKDTAIAGAKGRICQHCHTAITETQLLELASGQFVCCRSCGRGLYLID